MSTKNGKVDLPTAINRIIASATYDRRDYASTAHIAGTTRKTVGAVYRAALRAKVERVGRDPQTALGLSAVPRYSRYALEDVGRILEALYDHHATVNDEMLQAGQNRIAKYNQQDEAA